MTLKERIMYGIFMRMIDKSTKPFPKPVLEGGMVQDYDVPMRDGTTLVTHVYFPNKAGKYPVILVRSPYVYGMDIQKLIFCEYIKYGFILCYQEVRGRGESGGEWQPFTHEATDTEDTIKWLQAQSFAQEGIALLGNSYLSCVHLLAMDRWGSAVKTAFLPVFGDNLYDVAYQNGMLKEDFMLIWNLQNNTVKSLDGEALDDAYNKALTIKPRSNAMQKLLGGDVDFYSKILNNPSKNSPFWQAFTVPNASCVNVPICLLTGWYDFSVEGQMRIYSQLSSGAREKSRIIVGAWNHALMNKGDLKAKDGDICGVVALTLGLEWFLHIFYNYPLGEDFGVKYYQINSGFKLAKDFPAVQPHKMQFKGEKSFTHHPDKPFETCGGGAMSPRLIAKKGTPKQYNALQNPSVQQASGACVRYAFEPLQQDTDFFGSPKVSMELSSNCEDTAISVRLCLKKGKKEYFLCSGIASLSSLVKDYKAGSRVNVSFNLSPISVLVNKGSSLSVIISSADYPAFNSHPNRLGLFGESTEFAVATNTIYGGELEFE